MLSIYLFSGRWGYNRGELISEGGGLYPRGLIIGSIYFFTGRWGYNRGELISEGGGLYPRGLIIGSIYFFTGRWGYNREKLIISGMSVGNANSRLHEIFRHVNTYSFVLFS